MLKRLIFTVTAARRTLRQPRILPPAIVRAPRPVWDNGIDYNIPTFLRRGGIRPTLSTPAS